MKIVITGGSGKLGKHVIEEVEKFHGVTVFV